MSYRAVILAICCMLMMESSAPADEFSAQVKPFLTKYCVECHGEQEPKGDRRFDQLTATIHDDNELVDFQDALDQLNLSEMPPEDAEQPTDEERAAVIRWLTENLDRYHESHRGGAHETTLRRLNAREYRNTVRDLLHLNMTMFDPTENFPRDQTDEHLDNLGDTLVTSGHLLARYLEAADKVVTRALMPVVKPPTQTWTFKDDFRQQPEIDQVHRKVNKLEHMTLYEVVGADKHEGAYGPILAFADGVPVSGVYEIRFQAEAVNRRHPYEADFLGTDPEEPLRLGIVAGNRDVGELHLPQPIEPLLAEQELADEVKWYTARIWLDEGYTPRFTFRNGLMDVRELWSKLIKKYRDQFPQDIDSGIVSMRFNAIKHGKLPQIHLHEVEIEGPIMDEFPTASQRALLGKHWDPLMPSLLDPDDIPKRVREFASRAYRRPATDEEVKRILAVIRIRRSTGMAPIEAYADGVKAILSSPNFLYLDEATSTESATDQLLTPYALASRLSYFLWSSMPDEELFELAHDGTLTDPNVLQQQVTRMLADPKADALVEGFLGSWLGMRDLGATPPDRDEFSDFYHYDFDAAMRRETFLFTRYLLDQNLSIRHFLDSDFTFVNKALARLYDMEQPSGHEFERVAIMDRRRGGLLGQASVLTLTANGVDTSPVVRGVWLLDNLLGTPPSPPPPDVEPLDPDTRGATTIREQLEKHRNVASCNDCHRKIDPLGFALENFDPIGRWRTKYDSKTRVDSAGELPGGKQFADVVGLKEILLQQQEPFARAVTSKLLAYALGRHLEPADRPQVDAILAATAESEYRLADLVQQIAVSETFRSK
jgi:Protein of unknown function (DUF1592)/Protein of unknown function (DUF1588)/Protein of unknown function (DUF1585)/Protein of unknown function (DUF1587)/Protein of unknown function (DUF1595)/Planctomycete cytochrome C